MSAYDSLMFGRTYLALLALGACSFDTGNQVQGSYDGGSRVDARNIDASLIDASLTDASLTDASLTDASTDSGQIDATPDAMPDATPDAMPDATPDAMPDATPDAMPDATPDAMVCVGDEIGFTMLNLDRCDPMDPTGPLSLSLPGNYSLNTSSGELRNPNGMLMSITSTTVSKTALDVPDLFVVSVTDLSIAAGSQLRITGNRFPVFVAVGTINVSGQLRVVGRDFDGPGGDHSLDCVLRRGRSGENELLSPNLGGGGAGFAQSGGNGGALGGLGGGLVVLQGGASEIDSDLVPLRGGCDGGTGGGTGGGIGGSAGGAIELIARDSIEVGGSGVISASGGRGFGVSDNNSGGGGGGSGGGILLQSTNNVISGILSSNGGGGGEGSRTSTTTTNGQQGHIFNGNPALGGGDVSSGGDGGDGGTDTALGGLVPENGENGGMTGSGGGGGGGAAGYVVLVTQ